MLTYIHACIHTVHLITYYKCVSFSLLNRTHQIHSNLFPLTALYTIMNSDNYYNTNTRTHLLFVIDNNWRQ